MGFILSGKNQLPNPVISPGDHPDRWVLVDNYVLSDVTIPAGYVTDLATIPRIPGIYAYFKGRARRSAILHDWQYDNRLVPRSDADRMFYANMRLEGVIPSAAVLMYVAVRLAGWYKYGK